MRRLALLLSVLVGAHGLAAQGTPPLSLEGRVAPAVATQVQALADSLTRAGLPGQPVLRKALEGSAKGVAADRILAAVHTVAGQLTESARALGLAAVAADSETVEAGAYAINAGLKPEDVAEIARASNASHQSAGAIQTAGTLCAMGVPASQAVALVREWIASGRSPREVASLPSQVQAAMGHGLSASQAARGLAKGHGGQPAQPPPHPGNPGKPPKPTNRPSPSEHPQRP